MLTIRNPLTIAAPGGPYSHSAEVPPNARWLVTAGQVGKAPDGSIPDGFEDQHDQVWKNTVEILEDAGFGVEDIVRINVYSTEADGLRFLAPHRKKYLGDYAPPSTWVVVSQLANPRMVVEMETIAARSTD